MSEPYCQVWEAYDAADKEAAGKESYPVPSLWSEFCKLYTNQPTDPNNTKYADKLYCHLYNVLNQTGNGDAVNALNEWGSEFSNPPSCAS